MSVLVLITSAWGARNGGIDAFNTELAKAIRTVPNRPAKVVCLVLAADPHEIDEARLHDVTLIPIGHPDGGFAASRCNEVLDRIAREISGSTDIRWVGHDVISGELAVALASATSTMSAAIHHMS